MKPFYIIGLLVSIVQVARTQQEFASLQDLLNYADKHSIRILTVETQVEISASQKRMSMASLLPSINASMGFNDNIMLQPTLVPANLFNPSAPDDLYNEYTFGKKYVYSTGLQASWELINLQKLATIKTSDAQLQVSKSTVIQQKFETYQQLANTYYTLLLTRQSLHIANENALTTQAILTIASEHYQKGLISEENFNRATIQYLQASSTLTNLKFSLDGLIHQLQQLLNCKDTLLLTEHLSANPLFEDVEPINTIHPEIEFQEAQLKLASAQHQYSKSLFLPSLTLGYQYNFSWATDRATDLSGANELPQQYWGAKLNIPLFNGLTNKERLQQSNLKLALQSEELEYRKLAIQKDDFDMYEAFLHARTQLSMQQEMLDLQQKNDLHAENAYQTGLLNLDARLSKFQDLLTIQQSYIQALGDYYLRYSNLYIRKIVPSLFQ